MTRRGTLGLFAAASALSIASVVGAQDLTPPSLASEAEAVLPEGTELTEDVAVVLRLTIDAEGVVTEAEILESAGSPYDEAARAALLSFRFHPARRGDTPIASRISYRYVFHAPVVAEPASTEPEVEGEAEETDGGAPEIDPGADVAVSDPPDEPPLGVTAEVERDNGGILERSAEAVRVVDTREQHHRAVDIGDVLAREPGVAMRRAGGLGSSSRLSLAGLYGDQIPTFLDGVPLAVAGYPFGIANVPVVLVERVELYRGVVPIRFGADALGGAVNLVSTNASLRTGAAASYEVSSFETYRAALTGRYRDPGSGFTAGVTTFLDHSANNYPVFVDVPDERGRLREMRVPRFHDGYTAFGASADVGFAGTAWARRLLLRVYGTGYRRDLQHNVFMTVPYGEAEYGEQVYGASLRYEQDDLFGEDASIELVTNLSRRTIELYDVSRNRYGWDGRITRQVPVAGEINGPADDVYWEWTSFTRLLVRWAPAPEHELMATVTPTYSTRTGDDRLVDQTETFDPLSVRQDLTTVISGLSYRLRLFDERLENDLFAKHYFYHVRGEDLLSGNTVRTLENETSHVGVGDAFRFRFADWIWAKASYEYATRLPRPDEVFGDGAFVLANLELRPEVSHNVNVGAQIDVRDEQSTGRWQAQVNLFARIYDDRIVAYSDANTRVHRNILSASSLGAEASIAWTSPRRYVSLQANGTFQEQRNTSSTGEFGKYEGDRIPNIPWLFFNASATFRLPNVLTEDDALVLGWDTRYVHEFFRTWESVGLGGGKADHSLVPAQLVHGLHLGYQLPGELRTSTTFEIRNLTDERVYDFVGVQRAGRSFHLKLTMHL